MMRLSAAIAFFIALFSAEFTTSAFALDPPDQLSSILKSTQIAAQVTDFAKWVIVNDPMISRPVTLGVFNYLDEAIELEIRKSLDQLEEKDWIVDRVYSVADGDADLDDETSILEQIEKKKRPQISLVTAYELKEDLWSLRPNHYQHSARILLDFVDVPLEIALRNADDFLKALQGLTSKFTDEVWNRLIDIVNYPLNPPSVYPRFLSIVFQHYSEFGEDALRTPRVHFPFLENFGARTNLHFLLHAQAWETGLSNRGEIVKLSGQQEPNLRSLANLLNRGLITTDLWLFRHFPFKLSEFRRIPLSLQQRLDLALVIKDKLRITLGFDLEEWNQWAQELDQESERWIRRLSKMTVKNVLDSKASQHIESLIHRRKFLPNQNKESSRDLEQLLSQPSTQDLAVTRLLNAGYRYPELETDLIRLAKTDPTLAPKIVEFFVGKTFGDSLKIPAIRNSITEDMGAEIVQESLELFQSNLRNGIDTHKLSNQLIPLFELILKLAPTSKIESDLGTLFSALFRHQGAYVDFWLTAGADVTNPDFKTYPFAHKIALKDFLGSKEMLAWLLKPHLQTLICRAVLKAHVADPEGNISIELFAETLLSASSRSEDRTLVARSYEALLLNHHFWASSHKHHISTDDFAKVNSTLESLIRVADKKQIQNLLGRIYDQLGKAEIFHRSSNRRKIMARILNYKNGFAASGNFIASNDCIWILNGKMPPPNWN